MNADDDLFPWVATIVRLAAWMVVIAVVGLVAGWCAFGWDNPSWARFGGEMAAIFTGLLADRRPEP